MSCPVCKTPPETWLSVSCGHIICEDCVARCVQNVQDSSIQCPLCEIEIDRTNIRKAILPRELQDLTSKYTSTSLNLERSRLLHKHLNKRVKSSSKQAARLDSELLRSRQTQTELETTITTLQAQLDDITRQLERTQLNFGEREAEVNRLKEELQTTSHSARTQSTVASALGLRSLLLEDELVEHRVEAERWRAKYDQLETDFRRIALNRWTPTGSLAGGSSRRRSENENSDAISTRTRSSSSSTRNYTTPRSTQSASLLSPLPLPLESASLRSIRLVRSTHSIRSTHSNRSVVSVHTDLYPSPPSSPPPVAAVPTLNQVPVTTHPRPDAPCATNPASIPVCTSPLYITHRWITRGSNGYVRKYTCTGCDVVVKEKKVQRGEVLVWENVP